MYQLHLRPQLAPCFIQLKLSHYINYVGQNPEYSDTFKEKLCNLLCSDTFNEVNLQYCMVDQISIEDNSVIMDIKFSSIKRVDVIFYIDKNVDAGLSNRTVKERVEWYFTQIFCLTNEEIRRVVNAEVFLDIFADDVLNLNLNVFNLVTDPEGKEEYSEISVKNKKYILHTGLFIPVNHYFGIYIDNIDNALLIKSFGEEHFRIPFEPTNVPHEYLCSVSDLQDYIDCYNNNPILFEKYRDGGRQDFVQYTGRSGSLTFSNEDKTVSLSVLHYNESFTTWKFEMVIRGVYDVILESYENSPVYSYVDSYIVQYLISKYCLKPVL